MAARRMGIIVFLLCVCLCLTPVSAQAVSTTGAAAPIATEKDCSLTIHYRSEGTGFSAIPVKLYKVAEVSGDFQYSLTAPFAATGLVLNGIQSNSEWNAIRSTLEACILANGIEPTQTAETDASGQAAFQQLRPGLYLVSAVHVVQDSLRCSFGSALIALPGLGEDGVWQYQVEVAAKPEILPPEPDEEIQLKVLKLWKGDAGKTVRPTTIDVEIFCNGISYQTVTLSEENNWSYTWTALDDGAVWVVVERNVPAGYTMTVEERTTTFVLTNTWNPDTPVTPPIDTPETGDSSNILLYTTLMYTSGAMLIILGIRGKRRRYEETK